MKFLPALLLVALASGTDAKEPVDARVGPLLAKMTRAEKIGQLQLISIDGFVVSDWNSLSQLISEGIAADGPAAAKLAATAGVIMEMVTEIYREHLAALLDAGVIETSVLDGLVREILNVKFRMGLFEPPPQQPHAYPPLLAAERLEAVKNAAIASTVLLKNHKGTPRLEPGMFDIFLGTSSATTASVALTVTGSSPADAK